MKNKYQAYDIGVWLDHIDVNALSDVECAEIEHIDIESDEDLNWLLGQWIKPRFLLWDEKNRKEMIDIIKHSEIFPDQEIKLVFQEIQLPSGQTIDNHARFLNALRAEFLG